MPEQNVFSLEWDPIKPGVYNARVASLGLVYGPPSVLRIQYMTETEPPFILSEYLPFHAPRSHPSYVETLKGKMRIHQLAAAAGIERATITSPEMILELFLDKRVTMEVVLYKKDGFDVPKIHMISPIAGLDPSRPLP